MRAVVIHAAKDLRIEDVPAMAVGPDEIALRIEAAGICGSDLHYYQHGGFGPIRLKQPLILGHEIAGVVEAVGHAVVGMRPGVRVAVNPSRACRDCRFCRQGLSRHCLDMRFLGSAMRLPHVQGGFREVLSVDARQAVPIADHLTAAEAAMAEPLAVCLHAARQAGPLLGKRVLVTGCGPIGVLSILAARLAGAREIVATDISSAPQAIAAHFGAHHVLNVSEEPDALVPYREDKGAFDVVLEASGSEAALRDALDVLRPCGVLVQVGLAGDIRIPLNVLVAKEIEVRGTFRFDEEFDLAIHLMSRRAVDLKPLLTRSVPFTHAVEAFDLASDRSAAMKVQLAFA